MKELVISIRNYNGYLIMECGPNNYYNLTIQQYYKLAYERVKQLIALYEQIKGINQ